MADSPTTLIRCGAVRDAAGVSARPGAVAVRDGVIVAAGEERDVRDAAGGGRLGVDRVIDAPDTLILPAMVNAHAHLDLTDLGRRPYGGDFIDWIRTVMRDRPTDDAAITAAVRRGLRMSRDAGVGLLGDIAGTPTAVRARINAEQELQIAGTSWLECVGIGRAAEEAALQAAETVMSLRKELRRDDPAQFHIDYQPHAPYSAGLPLYELASDYNFGGRCASTHLAETDWEVEFIRDASGPFADLLKQLGKWDETIEPVGMTPVARLRDVLKRGVWTVVHCNYVTDDDIRIIAEIGNGNIAVAYCPVASDYFGHRGHRYRDMLAAGINVCLGTDSIVCQPPDEPQPLGILPQMRHLFRRDDVDADVLLAMATTSGAAAPAFHDKWTGTLRQGEPARLLGMRFDADDDTDPLVQVLVNDEPARPVGGAV